MNDSAHLVVKSVLLGALVCAATVVVSALADKPDLTDNLWQFTYVPWEDPAEQVEVYGTWFSERVILTRFTAFGESTVADRKGTARIVKAGPHEHPLDRLRYPHELSAPEWFRSIQDRPGQVGQMTVGVRNGWPFHCVEGVVQFTGDGNWFSILDSWRALPLGAHRVAGTEGPSAYSPILVTGLVWPGFLGNTLCYATLFWVLLSAATVCRERIRRWRGCCPVCAYSLTGLNTAGCPECGWRRL